MTETETIPESVMKAARKHVAEAMTEWKREFVADGSYDDHPGVQTCARAILAERRRCAKIAKRYVRPVPPKVEDESLEAAMSRLGVELGNGMAGIIADAIAGSTP